ncbi:MAG: helix-turn-helix transcriptional regulator [Candidatus Dadabacteria bacterium]|nr:MAG: helix-turn-helix transcriptional regulator [Candidatus Dadabacteria bacterium]
MSVLHIGDRIKEVRAELGISQKLFGEGIGIADSYVSEIESGNKVPSLTILLAIGFKYGVNIDWLESWNGEKYTKEGAYVTDEEIRILRTLRDKKELHAFVMLLIEKFKDRKEIVKRLTEFLKSL